MRKFSEFRQSLESGQSMQTEAVKQKMDELNEESWLNKGFALSQYARHSSIKQQIGSVLSSVNSLCDRGKNEQDIAEKIDILFDALKENVRVYRGLIELLSYNINVSVASALLSEDLRKVISTELAKLQGKK